MDLKADTAGFKDLTSQQVAVNNDQVRMNMAPSEAPAAFGSINQSSVPYGAGAASSFGQRTNYGFTGGL